VAGPLPPETLTPLSGFGACSYRHAMATVDPLPTAAPGQRGTNRTLLGSAVTYGAFPLVALAGTQFIQSGEIQSMGFAVDGIQKAFHVSDFTIALIPIAMNVVGIAGVLPFGVLADRWKRNLLLAVGTVIWTIAMGLTGLATSFLFLLLARMWVGGLEANSPAAISLIGDYWPVEQRPTKMGLYQMGNIAGALTAFAVGGVAVHFFGWRAAFIMWIPFGIVSMLLLLRSPEPRRGNHDLRETIGAPVGPLAGPEELADLGADDELSQVAAYVELPEPTRVGEGDYIELGWRPAFREILRIKSMWFGLASITVGQIITNALAFWGIPYFERVHHLGSAAAGGLAGLLAIGSTAGFLIGAKASERLLKRGVLNGKVYVIVVGSIAGTALLMPAFASPSLWVTAPLFFFGGFFLTIPVAPTEAMMADVVVCDLRGRAAMVRSIIRTMSAAGAGIVGGLSLLYGGHAHGLQWALVTLMPIYAIGGLICLGARKTYGTDLAFAIAETKRTEPFRAARHAAQVAPSGA
jgi:MFS family permease